MEDEVCVSAEESSYTRPEEVEEFVSRTGVDSLAIAIGTSHGAYKFTAEQSTRNEEGVLMPPPLRFDIRTKILSACRNSPSCCTALPLCRRNSSSRVNHYGGKMPDAVGIPEDQLRIAAKKAVCKINIDSDLRLAMTASLRHSCWSIGSF